jgi:gas vesicle protein
LIKLFINQKAQHTMRTKLDYSSLGESKGTYSNTSKAQQGYAAPRETGYTTNSSIREMKKGPQTDWSSSYSSNKGSGATGIAMGLLAGAGVGVLAAILMAPDKGRTTRRRLSDSAAWVGRGITEKFQNNKGKIDSWIGKAEDTIKGSTDSMNKTGSGSQHNL